MEPRLTATLYTERIDEHYFDAVNARGYAHGGKAWAIVDIGGVQLTAVDDAGLAGMRRLRDALDTAISQAVIARQDDETKSLVSA